MKNTLKYSFIIPVYNVEKYLKQCIDSILSQTYTTFEVVLIDDGSKDDSGKMCDDYVDRLDNVRVIHQNNQGLSVARNNGILIASGDYLIFCDSDDYYLTETFLEKINDVLSNRSYDILFFQRRKLLERTNTLCLPPPEYDEEINNEKNTGKLLCHLSEKGQLDASACLKVIQREKCVMFKPGILSEDVEWIFRLLLTVDNIGVLNAPEYCYRIRNESISHSISYKNIDDLVNTLCTSSDLVKHTSKCENTKIALLDYLTRQFYISVGLIGAYLKGRQRRYLIKKVDTCKWVTRYCINKNNRLCRTIQRMFLGSTTAMSLLLGIYVQQKRKNI